MVYSMWSIEINWEYKISHVHQRNAWGRSKLVNNLVYTHITVSIYTLFSIVVECDSATVEKQLQECVPEWSNFGLMLGLSKTDIDIIDSRDPFSNYLSDTIHYWMDNSKTLYWEVLIRAIKDLGNKRLANELEKEFLKWHCLIYNCDSLNTYNL